MESTNYVARFAVNSAFCLHSNAFILREAEEITEISHGGSYLISCSVRQLLVHLFSWSTDEAV